jgi:cytochrome c oxidase cbb3-type subunit I/II
MDTVLQLIPLYWIRLVGGTMYLLGLLLKAWNLVKTAIGVAPKDGPEQVTAAPESLPTPAK